jgi:hypothetical protein
LQLLQALEKELINELRILFEHEPQNAFLHWSMQGSSCYLFTLKVLRKFIGVKPLSRKLVFHVDNCVKDNKNCHLLGS